MSPCRSKQRFARPVQISPSDKNFKSFAALANHLEWWLVLTLMTENNAASRARMRLKTAERHTPCCPGTLIETTADIQHMANL